MNDKKNYGVLTVGALGATRELAITDFIQTNCKDNRVISICGIEDGSYLCAVENPESSGRETRTQMWLSKESLIGLLISGFMYFEARGLSLSDLCKEAMTNDILRFQLSDNIKPDETLLKEELLTTTKNRNHDT